MKNSRNKPPPSDLSLEVSQEDSDSEDVPISQRRGAASKHRAAANPKVGRKPKKKLKHVPEPESDYEVMNPDRRETGFSVMKILVGYWKEGGIGLRPWFYLFLQIFSKTMVKFYLNSYFILVETLF